MKAEELREKMVNEATKFLKDFASQDVGNYPTGILVDRLLSLIKQAGYLPVVAVRLEVKGQLYRVKEVKNEMRD